MDICIMYICIYNKYTVYNYLICVCVRVRYFLSLSLSRVISLVSKVPHLCCLYLSPSPSQRILFICLFCICAILSKNLSLVTQPGPMQTCANHKISQSPPETSQLRSIKDLLSCLRTHPRMISQHGNGFFSGSSF